MTLYKNTAGVTIQVGMSSTLKSVSDGKGNQELFQRVRHEAHAAHKSREEQVDEEQRQNELRYQVSEYVKQQQEQPAAGKVHRVNAQHAEYDPKLNEFVQSMMVTKMTEGKDADTEGMIASFVMDALRKKAAMDLSLNPGNIELQRKCQKLQDVRLVIASSEADIDLYFHKLWDVYGMFLKSMKGQHGKFYGLGTFEDVKREMGKKENRFLLAVHGSGRKQAVFGFIWSSFASKPAVACNTCYTHAFFTDEKFQGLGIGQALIATMDLMAKFRGIAFFFLLVSPNAEAAKNLYAKMGYYHLGYVRDKHMRSLWGTVVNDVKKFQETHYSLDERIDSEILWDTWKKEGDILLFKYVNDTVAEYFQKIVHNVLETRRENLGGDERMKDDDDDSDEIMELSSAFASKCAACGKLMQTSSNVGQNTGIHARLFWTYLYHALD